MRTFLLAAGRGRRAGGPKAWREEAGRAWLERQIEFLLGLHQPTDVTVSIQADWAERCAAINPAVRWVAVDADAAPLASLQRLLSARPAAGWAFCYHVDMPVWERGLFELLAARRPAPGAPIDALVPIHGGRRGHPVLLSPAAQEAISGLDPLRDRLDGWLRTRRVAEVEAPFPCVLENRNR